MSCGVKLNNSCKFEHHSVAIHLAPFRFMPVPSGMQRKAHSMFGKIASLVVLSGLISQYAWAGPHYGSHSRYHHHRAHYDYAEVIDVRPIYRTVRRASPVGQCSHRARAAGPMIVGGLVGAAVGNRIGSGKGRQAATVAGAVIGSAIGHDHARHCETRYPDRYHSQLEGYHVTYQYGGHLYHTRLPYHPGHHLRIRIDGQSHYRY